MCDGSDSKENFALRKAKENTGRWTQEEHELFVRGLHLYNKQWKSIAEMIQTRSIVQIRTHAQKYFQKLLKSKDSQGPLEHDHIVHKSLNNNSENPSPSNQVLFARTKRLFPVEKSDCEFSSDHQSRFSSRPDESVSYITSDTTHPRVPIVNDLDSLDEVARPPKMKRLVEHVAHGKAFPQTAEQEVITNQHLTYGHMASKLSVESSLSGSSCQSVEDLDMLAGSITDNEIGAAGDKEAASYFPASCPLKEVVAGSDWHNWFDIGMYSQDQSVFTESETLSDNNGSSDDEFWSVNGSLNCFNLQSEGFNLSSSMQCDEVRNGSGIPCGVKSSSSAYVSHANLVSSGCNSSEEDVFRGHDFCYEFHFGFEDEALASGVLEALV